ncbi:hypothetical protein DFH11DRAFT_228665 [Phellopilus nigrolimitatus]|nr:hypothetical protein DFH11DRAFT_228665 [Phellopilus nigrolimitatus]
MAALARLSLLLAVLCTVVPPVLAHAHHDELTEEEKNAPVDAVLWIHMALQIAIWGFLFPIGMVLGISRSRWHVPLQSAGFALTTAGYFLGHSHKGRAFLPSVHGTFARILYIPIVAQLVLGIYLKLHIHEKSVRPWAVRAHGVLGKAYPILGWTQMLFGAITFRGYCRGGNLGQCLAHYLMGSGFIAYGIIMAILLIAGEAWIKRTRRSPEWWDSWVIMLWGIVNTFTEHRGAHWSVKDMQHTSLGVIWWVGGALGIWLSRHNQRSVVPSLIIMITGWAMSEHAQALMISTKVHAMFGNVLMLAGLARIIEVCFVAPSYERDVPAADSDRHSERTLAPSGPSISENPRLAIVQAFRHLPPFLLIAAGLLFMSATDEELDYVHENEMDHVTYVLIMLRYCPSFSVMCLILIPWLSSLASVIYAFVLFLINVWGTTGRNAPGGASSSQIGLQDESLELDKWYQSVPAAEADAHPISPQFVIGEHEHDRD